MWKTYFFTEECKQITISNYNGKSDVNSLVSSYTQEDNKKQFKKILCFEEIEITRHIFLYQSFLTSSQTSVHITLFLDYVMTLHHSFDILLCSLWLFKVFFNLFSFHIKLMVWGHNFIASQTVKGHILYKV